MTVEELMAKLAKMPPDATVKVWMPGTYISLSNVFVNTDDVLIEGNIE